MFLEVDDVDLIVINCIVLFCSYNQLNKVIRENENFKWLQRLHITSSTSLLVHPVDTVNIDSISTAWS